MNALDKEDIAIPVEDEECNFRMLKLDDIDYVTKITDDPCSTVIYHVDDGKQYSPIHTNKAAQQFNSWIHQEKRS
ncbi:MAG: hypothetical protein K6T85_11610 [Gorillibacterium sp.]|nr:hypothetical protein [Gorillibacterium sp.]